MAPIKTLYCLAGMLMVLTAAAQTEVKKPTLSLEELFGDSVVAKGPGVVVHQSQLNRAFTAYRSALAARGKRVPETQRLMNEAMLLDKLIITQVLSNRSSRTDRSLASGVADKFYNDSKESAGSEERFVRQLQVTGLTTEQFRVRIYEQALAESVVERELKSTIKVSDKEVKDFYETGTDVRIRLISEEIELQAGKPGTDPKVVEALRQRMASMRTNNLSRLNTPETVTVSHVLISTRIPNTERQLPKDKKEEKMDLALQVLKKVRDGVDFDSLILNFSEDRNLQETKGRYTISRQARFAPEFVAASFSLDLNQVSDIVTTVFGYHIIKKLETTPGKKEPFSKVEKSVHKFLIEQNLQRDMPAYFRKIKVEANIEIVDPKYKAIMPKEPGAIELGVGNR